MRKAPPGQTCIRLSQYVRGTGGNAQCCLGLKSQIDEMQQNYCLEVITLLLKSSQEVSRVRLQSRRSCFRCVEVPLITGEVSLWQMFLPSRNGQSLQICKANA